MAIKRVEVAELRPGMYVHDLNCGWLNHGFLRSRFLLRDPGQIQKLKDHGVSAIYIDTARGEDVAEAPTRDQVEAGLDRELKGAAAAGAAHPPARVPQREEASVARKILGEAVGVVTDLLHDVRLGRQLEPDKARPLVKAMHASAMRNPGALISLGRIKQADTYTFEHSVSICALLMSFCQALDMDAATVEEAGMGGLLHDIGKMKVPNEILNKPGKLTEDEFAIMKSHAALSRDILSGVPGISTMVIQIAGEHHEKVAGGGYPLGLAGEAISQIGRMTAIVDVYDALTSTRVYRKGQEPTLVMRRLLEWSGSHLDHELVQRFIRTLGIYPVGSLVRLGSGRLAVVVEQGENLLKPTVRVVFDSTRKVRLQPRDLDLARTGGEEIQDYEDPSTWKLDPAAFL